MAGMEEVNQSSDSKNEELNIAMNNVVASHNEGLAKIQENEFNEKRAKSKEDSQNKAKKIMDELRGLFAKGGGGHSDHSDHGSHGGHH